jgi:small subunit ribosomal protein S16
VLLKKHLLGGVTKGAFTEAEAESKFEAWKSAKQSAVRTQRSELSEAEKAAQKVRLDAEKVANKAKAEALAAKRAELLKVIAKANALEEVPAVEETPAPEAAAE